MTWNIDPIIFKFDLFSVPFEIRYYGILFALAFLFGYLFFKRMYRLEGKPLEDLDFGLYLVMAGTIVGARLGHCLFYEPEVYLNDPLRIFNITEGGLASHGGAIGVLLAILYYSKKKKDQPFIWVCDRLAYPVALAGCMIRLGNFFNSEILGRPTDLPWGVVFERYDDVARHPSMLYESFSYFCIFLVLFRVYEKYREKMPYGLTTGLFFIMIFTVRFFIEFTKIEQVDFEKGMPLNMGQLLSIPFVTVGIVLVMRALKSQKKETSS